MKKLLSLSLLCFLALVLCACGGKSDGLTIVPAESSLYTQEDISAAISTAVAYFNKEFKGCTLTEIGYAGDEMTKMHIGYAGWQERYDADEMIVLLSSFDVDSSGGDGSLNPNSTYTGWNWILVRNSGGPWRHVDHGY